MSTTTINSISTSLSITTSTIIHQYHNQYSSLSYNEPYTSIQYSDESAKTPGRQCSYDFRGYAHRILFELVIVMDAILTNLMAENIPALPVHDSFIVPQQYEGLLKQQMVDEYEKILGFEPGVSKKEQRFFPKKWKNWHYEKA